MTDRLKNRLNKGSFVDLCGKFRSAAFYLFIGSELTGMQLWQDYGDFTVQPPETAP